MGSTLMRSGGCGSCRDAQQWELAGGEPASSASNSRRGSTLPSATCASIPWRSRRVRASWRRHHTRSPNTITCSSPATPASVWAVTPRSSGSPSPPLTRCLGDEALAHERGRERGLRVGQGLRVDARVDEDADISQDDSLCAGELGECLSVEIGPRFERLQLAEDPEQPPVRLLPSAADRVASTLGEGGIGVERERLGRTDLGHPGLHVAPRDPHEVRAVVDPKAMGR